jgi:hypothetical protein
VIADGPTGVVLTMQRRVEYTVRPDDRDAHGTGRAGQRGAQRVPDDLVGLVGVLDVGRELDGRLEPAGLLDELDAVAAHPLLGDPGPLPARKMTGEFSTLAHIMATIGRAAAEKMSQTHTQVVGLDRENHPRAGRHGPFQSLLS